jgi:predicted nuclease of predicted toxin-antitoxin system
VITFLADACCDALIVRTLRTLGCEVTFVAESDPNKPDEAILAQGLAEQRIIVTEDRDFCELVFHNLLPTYGVVLVRIPAAQRPKRAERITLLVTDYAERLPYAMTTLTLANIRIRPLTGPPDEPASKED